MLRQDRRNAQRYQERPGQPDGSGRLVLREQTDASAAGRFRRVEQRLRQAEQQTAQQVEAQRTAERAVALAAQRLRAALALPEARSAEREQWPDE